jgi:thiol-disulfide isomerase/thioredoxin
MVNYKTKSTIKKFKTMRTAKNKMLLSRTTFRNIILLFVIVAASTFTLKAQDEKKVTLQVGDKAPELQYGQWLKGTPIKSYEKGRLYIFEFWATWCGPCKAMMPHLSKFAKERQKDVTVIGVNIWEGSHSADKKPYDSYLPKVKKFVESMGDNMAYNVIMDNNDEFMAKNWMLAAGQQGIPCSFMVKDETIMWIGHPIALDSIVQLVFEGKFDVDAERANNEKKRADEASGASGQFEKIYSEYEKAVKDKQYNKALSTLQAGIDQFQGVANALNFFKFQTLLDYYTEDSAMAFVKPWQSLKPGYTGSVGATIARKPGLSKDTYLYAIGLLEGLIDNPQPAAFMYQEIAVAYSNIKDYKKAVEMQEKAIAIAKQCIKEGKYVGFIMDDTVKEFEETLKGYKEKL